LRRRLESLAFRPPFRRLDFSLANEQTLTWQSEPIFTATLFSDGAISTCLLLVALAAKGLTSYAMFQFINS